MTSINEEILYNATYRKYINAYLSRTKTIRGCDRCNSTGFTSREECTDYHRREFNIFHDVCKTCNGCGRLTVTIDKVTIGNVELGSRETWVPFTTDPIDKPFIVCHGEGKVFQLNEE